MIYNNTSELLAILKGNNIWAKKKLGQNFLVNMEALKNIITAAELTKEDHVLEIGPGLGILTEQLARHAGKVTAIEFDQTIIPVLHKNLLLEDVKNVEILNEDALKTELPTEPYKIVANIPYYITSPLLNHFLQPKTTAQLRPTLIVLLIQKEVAEKICTPDAGQGPAPTGKKLDHSVLSLQVQAFGKPQIVCTVGKSSFFPQPKVDSAVIKIQPYSQPRITNIELFFKLIKGAFHQKRKMLSNTIPNTLGLNAHQAEKLFSESKIAPTARPQNISLDQWNALIQAYEKI